MKKISTNTRKKEYLNDRKKAKKMKRLAGKRHRDSDDEGDENVSAETIDFREQAERPPEFKVVPKDRRNQAHQNKTLDLNSIASECEEEDINDKFRRKQELRKKKEMEDLSKSVQEAYKALKSRARR